MHKIATIAAVLVAAVSLSACTTTQKTAAVGATAGAIVGGATTGSVLGATAGAIVGGVTGAVAGELIGRYDRDPTQCVWQDSRGRRFLAPCSPHG